MNDNLLLDPVITVRNGAGAQRLSLPGVLAALGRDEVEDFPALRPHQRHSWHAFLCQLAVLALEEAGRNFEGDPLDEVAWRELLRGLAPGFPGDEPWRLVVGDLAKPAFLQPSVPEGMCNSWSLEKSSFCADILVLSKQHGEKHKIYIDDNLNLATFALVTKQTQSEYSAAGKNGRYYQTVRQAGIPFNNLKVASRPSVSLHFSPHPGPTWLRDCRILLNSLDELRRSADYPGSGGLRLLWLEPWRGTVDESLPLRRLHPLFVEICRRIRLIDAGDGTIQYRTVGTKASRVAAKEYNGAVGDPWLPLKREAGSVKAYNSRPGYDVAWKVLFDDSEYVPSLLQRFHPGDPEEGVSVVFRVFLRTQGGSDGYHERIIPIQKNQLNFFRKHRDRAAEMAKALAGAVKIAVDDVLRPALQEMMQQSAKSRIKREQWEWIKQYTKNLGERVDSEFFSHLWRCLDARGEEPLRAEHLASWDAFLAHEARAAFRAAFDALPTVSALRHRVRAKAENMLEACIRKHLVTRSDNDSAN